MTIMTLKHCITYDSQKKPRANLMHIHTYTHCLHICAGIEGTELHICKYIFIYIHRLPQVLMEIESSLGCQLSNGSPT